MRFQRPRITPPRCLLTNRVSKRLHNGPDTQRLPQVPVTLQTFDTIPIPTFKGMTKNLAEPLLLKRPGDAKVDSLPALKRWFLIDEDGDVKHRVSAEWSGTAVRLNYPYFNGVALENEHPLENSTRLKSEEQGGHHGVVPKSVQGRFLFPYELMYPQLDNSGNDVVKSFSDWALNRLSASDSNNTISEAQSCRDAIHPLQGLQGIVGEPRFHQVHASLKLLQLAQRYNSKVSQERAPLRLYIAQVLILDLTTHLQKDVPTPEIPLKSGKGDIYDSSIWLGLEPTYTPLHRDPNHNLFIQLSSRKQLRLLPPSLGERLYREVRAELGIMGSSRIRGTEMMEGPERELLDRKIWERPEAEGKLEGLLEVGVGPGDALFVPMGWWHSVKSLFADGRLNASVNWWFR